MNKSNQYTCLYVTKDSVLPDSDNNDNTNYILQDDDYQDTMVYTVDDNKIIEQYCFKNGDFSLYRDNGNDMLQVLFACANYSNEESSFILLRPHGVYLGDKNAKSFSSLIYMSAHDFKEFQKMVYANGPQFLQNFYNNSINKFLAKHSVNIISDGALVQDFSRDYETFRNLFIRYSVASQYIPASDTIKRVLNKMTHYFASRQLDEEDLLRDFEDLQNFNQLCPESINIIEQFINRTPKTDLRNLYERLQGSYKNISSLIDMYLQEELER